MQLSTFGYAHDKKNVDPKAAARRAWVDSVYDKLTEQERIGQLFMVAAYSGGKNYNEEAITNMIANHQIGGLIFMQGGPGRQANLTNKYQRMAQVPLLISMDAEWGLGMRLDSIRNFPRQMMLGATRDTALVYRMGLAIGRQCKRLGVHIDFAPDVDVNNNPGNPVINSRSFGEHKGWVSKLARAYMRGLQKMGVIACAKHFPGHGDTDVDSHNDLPKIGKSYQQLDSLELFPFKQLIASGVKSVMVGHLEVPAFDTTKHLPSSLSKNIITDLLKDKLGYNGLIVTDGLAMQGVVKYFPAGEADYRAFLAGSDILLFSQDVPNATLKIKTALDSGIIDRVVLERSVKKILAAKYDVGLHEPWVDISTEHIAEDINEAVDSIKLQTAKEAITLVADENQILPKLNDNARIAYVGFNAAKPTTLFNQLKDKFVTMDAYWLAKGTALDSAQKVIDKLEQYDAVIVGMHSVSFYTANNYGLSSDFINILQQASCRTNTMMVVMGNAYAMQYICGARSMMVTYEDDSLTEVVAADILLRKQKAKGVLPVTACKDGKSVCPAPIKPVEVAKEVVAKELTPVMYPADAGVIDMGAIDKMNLFVERCVADGVFPGARVLAAKNGKVFINRAYGYQNYDKEFPIDTNTLYDLASCTKMLATNIAIMRLYEEGKISLDSTLGKYLPIVKGSDKATITIRELLQHQAGLKSWIPFYKETLNDRGKPQKAIYRKKQSKEYSIPVCNDMYMLTAYKDTIWGRIINSPKENIGKSVYSDLDFIFLGALVEAVSGKALDKYVEEEFYKPLGLKNLLFNPLRKYDTTQIAPTEIDVNFRDELIHGYVHDPGAAMLGGVAGHAGLFGTAQDVAVVFQMLLNKGTYGGKKYFKPATVELFTTYQSSLNHRGLGFDKPATDENDGGPAGARTSAAAFGHQGFTGTCVWADPATGVLFVFLSNRVYPSATNSKINKLNVRTLTQDYIYEALGIPVNHTRMDAYKQQTTKK